jgi:hypothetical protein
VEEKAEGVAGGVEHDAQAIAISIGRLPWSLGTTKLDGACNRDFKVLDLHFEVEHLGLLALVLGPRGRLVPRPRPDVDVNVATGVEQLGPMWSELTDLEPKEAFVEPGHWFCFTRAVDRDTDPLIQRWAHGTSLLEAKNESNLVSTNAHLMPGPARR